MIIPKGITVGISINGIAGFIAEILDPKAKTWLQLIGPQTADEKSHYNVFDRLPLEDDQNSFAVLYRCLQAFVDKGELEGPYGEDHSALFNRFDYVDPARDIRALLADLAGADFLVKVTDFHRTSEITGATEDEEDRQIEKLRVELAEWVDENTQTDPRELPV